MVTHSSSNSRLRIFISYGHDELVDFALRLKEDLVAIGHEVWFDLDRLKPGADWENYIEEGLDWVSSEGNGRIILIMTPHSVRRPDGFCLNEVAMALMKNLKIMPIMLVWCEPPLSICRIQWLDMQDCLPLEDRWERYNAKFRGLLEALEHGTPNFEGSHSNLFNVLKPLSFDSEIRYKQDKFTGREWVLEEVDRWLEDTDASRIFWISGGPGVGKTALSSYLAAHRPDIVAFHFCRYDNVQKSDPRRAVMSIAYQLSTQLPDYAMRLSKVKLDDLDGQDTKTLFDHLIVQPLSANYPAPQKKVIVLIDALDEATADGKNEMAGSIASAFERTPAWLRLIITSRLSPEIVGALQAYTPFMIDINDPRNDQDIKAYLTRELGRLNADVKPSVVKEILKKSGGLFLYVEWVVAEIGKGRLSLDRLDEFPKGLGGIYLKFFERQFPDIGEWETQVAPALEVIAAAQEPLSLDTIADIFGWNAREERKLRLSLGALFNFDQGAQPFHKSIIEWLSNEDKQDPYFVSVEEGNKRLTEYLWKEYRSSRWSAYLVNYIPMHLCVAERWADLEEVLQDMKFVRTAFEAGKIRFMSQWIYIEEHSRLRMEDLYGRMSLEAMASDDDGLLAVAELLMRTTRTDAGLQVINFLTGRFRETKEMGRLSRALYLYVTILLHGGSYQKALPAAKELEDICRSTGDVTNLRNALLQQYLIYYNTGCFEKAHMLMPDVESLLLETGDTEKQLEYLSIKACILLEKDNDIEGELTVLGEQEKIAREHGFLNILDLCLSNIGDVYLKLGDNTRALALFKEAAQIARRIGHGNILCVSLINEGIAFESLGQLDDAMAAFGESEKILRESKSWEWLALSLQGQGRVLVRKNSLKEALPLYSEAEQMLRESGSFMLAEFLGDYAMVLARLGDHDGCAAHLKEMETLCRKHGLNRVLQICLEQQRALLEKCKSD